MKSEFEGRPVLPAQVEGEAVVTRMGFSTLACYYKSVITRADRAICGDQNNPDLFNLDLTDKVICLPTSIGSTSAGATWDQIAKLGIAPRAMLFAEPIDSLSAAGLVVIDVWQDRRICTVDRLGEEFLNTVQTGQRVRIDSDGKVTLLPMNRERPLIYKDRNEMTNGSPQQ